MIAKTWRIYNERVLPVANHDLWRRNSDAWDKLADMGYLVSDCRKNGGGIMRFEYCLISEQLARG